MKKEELVKVIQDTDFNKQTVPVLKQIVKLINHPPQKNFMVAPPISANNKGQLATLALMQKVDGRNVVSLAELERKSGVTKGNILAIQDGKTTTCTFEYVCRIAQAFDLPSVAPVLGFPMPVIATWPIPDKPIAEYIGKVGTTYDELGKNPKLYDKSIKAIDQNTAVRIRLSSIHALTELGIHIDDIFRYRYRGNSPWIPELPEVQLKD